MAFNAKIHTDTYEETLVVNKALPFALKAIKMGAAQGVLKAGTIVAVNASDEAVKYQKGMTGNVGTGDGAVKAFSATLAGAPLRPGSVVITDGTGTLTDTGSGNFLGDGFGFINYETGDVSVEFTAAPADTVSVDATFDNDPVTVIVEEIDTTSTLVGRAMEFGAAVKDTLLVGDAAPDATDLKRLKQHNIYALA